MTKETNVGLGWVRTQFTEIFEQHNEEPPMTDDDNVIRLPTKAYEQFVDAVNQPGNPNVALTELLTSPSGFGTDEGGLASMDVETFLSIRNWVSDACTAKGATFLGGGVGCGVADLQIEIEGFEYNITIKPLPRS